MKWYRDSSKNFYTSFENFNSDQLWFGPKECTFPGNWTVWLGSWIIPSDLISSKGILFTHCETAL